MCFFFPREEGECLGNKSIFQRSLAHKTQPRHSLLLPWIQLLLDACSLWVCPLGTQKLSSVDTNFLDKLQEQNRRGFHLRKGGKVPSSREWALMSGGVKGCVGQNKDKWKYWNRLNSRCPWNFRKFLFTLPPKMVSWLIRVKWTLKHRHRFL